MRRYFFTDCTKRFSAGDSGAPTASCGLLAPSLKMLSLTTKHLPRAARSAGGWHSRHVLPSLQRAQRSGHGSQLSRWFMKTQPAKRKTQKKSNGKITHAPKVKRTSAGHERVVVALAPSDTGARSAPRHDALAHTEPATLTMKYFLCIGYVDGPRSTQMPATYFFGCCSTLNCKAPWFPIYW